VRACDSASVRACDSASVRAYGSASVRAYGSASVEAYGSASVSATPFVAVQRHGDRAKVSGGVLIQIPPLDTAKQFCEFYGIKASRGTVTVYKAVGNSYTSEHGATYTPGGTTSCDDWSAEPRCGGGLHFSPRPFMARKYSGGPRFVACRVKLTDLVVIRDYGTPDKVKAPRCKVLYECNEDGEKLA
jgi:hypothetical protein